MSKDKREIVCVHCEGKEGHILWGASKMEGIRKKPVWRLKEMKTVREGRNMKDEHKKYCLWKQNMGEIHDWSNSVRENTNATWNYENEDEINRSWHDKYTPNSND